MRDLSENAQEKRQTAIRKSKVKYTDKPIGKIKIVEDFLPKPKDLELSSSQKISLRVRREAKAERKCSQSN